MSIIKFIMSIFNVNKVVVTENKYIESYGDKIAINLYIPNIEVKIFGKKIISKRIGKKYGIVFCHGLGAMMDKFFTFFEEDIVKEYTVITPDIRSHHESDRELFIGQQHFVMDILNFKDIN